MTAPHSFTFQACYPECRMSPSESFLLKQRPQLIVDVMGVLPHMCVHTTDYRTQSQEIFVYLERVSVLHTNPSLRAVLINIIKPYNKLSIISYLLSLFLAAESSSICPNVVNC